MKANNNAPFFLDLVREALHYYSVKLVLAGNLGICLKLLFLKMIGFAMFYHGGEQMIITCLCLMIHFRMEGSFSNKSMIFPMLCSV